MARENGKREVYIMNKETKDGGGSGERDRGEGEVRSEE